MSSKKAKCPHCGGIFPLVCIEKINGTYVKNPQFRYPRHGVAIEHITTGGKFNTCIRVNRRRTLSAMTECNGSYQNVPVSE